MKALVIIVLLILPSLVQAQSGEAPASVQESIEARNDAAVFSMTRERMELAAFSLTEEVPEHTNSEGLANVFARLSPISECILNLYPGTIRRRGPESPGTFGSLAQALVPSAITEVETTLEPAPNRLVVQVQAHRFLRDTNLELINGYAPDSTVPELSPGQILGSGPQIMTWIQVGDTWMKRAGVVEALDL